MSGINGNIMPHCVQNVEAGDCDVTAFISI